MSLPWIAHSKHVIVFTTAGKPVWSRFGDDAAQAALTPVMQAVLSRAEEGGDALTSLSTADGTLFLATTRGPLHVCAIVRTGETLHALAQQLRCVWAYLLFHTLPTASILTRLAARPGADVRAQCEGVDAPLRAMLRFAAASPSVWLDAYPIVALPSVALRTRAAAALATAGKLPSSGSTGSSNGRVVYAILTAGHGVVAWAQPARSAESIAADASTTVRGGGGSGGGHSGSASAPSSATVSAASASSSDFSLRPLDLHCLLVFAASMGPHVSTAPSGDAWFPVALPGLSTSATLHAYMVCLTPGGAGIGGSGEGTSVIAASPSSASVSTFSVDAGGPLASSSPLSTPVKAASSSRSPLTSGPSPNAPPTPTSPRLRFPSPLAMARQYYSYASTSTAGGGGLGGDEGVGAVASGGGSGGETRSFAAAIEEAAGGGLQGSAAPHAAAATAAAPAFPSLSSPPVYLFLLSAGGGGGEAEGGATSHAQAVAARASTIARRLAEDGVTAAAARWACAPRACGGFLGGDVPASAFHAALGLPPLPPHRVPTPAPPPPTLTLLHYIYLWKPARQWTASAWPRGFCDSEVECGDDASSLLRARAAHRRRKALLRALAHSYEAITVATPHLRLAVSAFQASGASAQPQSCTVQWVAGLHTNYSIVLAAWGFDGPPPPPLDAPGARATALSHSGSTSTLTPNSIDLTAGGGESAPTAARGPSGSNVSTSSTTSAAITRAAGPTATVAPPPPLPTERIPALMEKLAKVLRSETRLLMLPGPAHLDT